MGRYHPRFSRRPAPEQDQNGPFVSIDFVCLHPSAPPGAVRRARRFCCPSSADARIGGYDGVWNVTFATTRGVCSSGYSVPFTVTGNRVSSAGGGRVSGTVNRDGAVAVQVSVGASHASGGGRLAGAAGAGSWRGIISGDQCSGTWQATRT